MTAPAAQYAAETDEALMARVAEGDALAFAAIYDRHHRQAYSLARRITGQGGGAEDATQDAFFSLWGGAARFDPNRGRLTSWLLTLVRNRSIDLLRRGAPHAAHQDLFEHAAERIEAPERTEEKVQEMQESEQTRRLVAELPPEQREVIDLAYFAGYTQAEIAARVGVPLGTVKSRVRLGLEKLRDNVEREPVLLSAA